jgi:nicotinamidase-related amidase
MVEPTTALLLMDLQRNIVERYPDPAVLERAAAAADAARAAAVPVVFVRVAFREGGPEIAASNRRFAAAKSRAVGGEDAEAVRIADEVAPHPGEPVVVKRRVSAFTGSDLEVLLRGLGARRLVLAGIATSGVVLSTLLEAADRDFELAVLADACADADPEVHRVLLEKVFPKAADVVTVAEWAASLR